MAGMRQGSWRSHNPERERTCYRNLHLLDVAPRHLPIQTIGTTPTSKSREANVQALGIYSLLVFVHPPAYQQ
jgi:hypothetical protein